MATIKRSLATKTTPDGKKEIHLRVSIRRGNAFRLKSGIYVKPERFRDGCFIKPKANQLERQAILELEYRLLELEKTILESIENDPNLTKEGLLIALGRTAAPAAEVNNPSEELFNAFEDFLKEKSLSAGTEKMYRVLARALKRFQAFKTLSSGKHFALTFDSLTEPLKEEIKAFLTDESKAFALFPQIYEDTKYNAAKGIAPESHGRNYMVTVMKRLTAFLKWSADKGLSKVNPHFPMGNANKEIYGDPIFLTVEERDRIAAFDFSKSPHLETQRDIFIFHCFVGCRVSDLVQLTRDNIVNGTIYYIPRKTQGENAATAGVPLHPTAATLVKKYEGRSGKGLLFPFISPQKYNVAIKKILQACGIDRMVTVINPKTQQQEQKPIWETASSHLARRTFIGTLYSMTPDPNVIGAMSGHVEGSKAFSRYRTIDLDIKTNLINQL